MSSDKELAEVSKSRDDDAERGCCTNGYFDQCCRPVVAEFVGSLIYVFAAGMAVQSADVMVIATAQGLAILSLAITFTPVSGGQFNPALTLAALIGGQISPVKSLFYVISQLIGSVAAAGVVKGLSDKTSYDLYSGGAPMVSGTTTLSEALALETILGFVLVLSYLLGHLDLDNALAPVAHGLVYLVGLSISTPISGGVINPLRSFGLSVVYSSVTIDHWTEQWIYYVSSASGAVLAAIIYKLLLASDDKRWGCSDNEKLE